MKQIPIYPRNPFLPIEFTLVDDEDYSFLVKFKWYCVKTNSNKYAATKINNKTTHMHQLLLLCEIGYTPDHIDGNGLNNQKNNLRPSTPAQQQMNRAKNTYRDFTSSHKGVCWDRFTKSWKAYIKINGKHKNLGRFHTEKEAHEAYEKVAEKLFGEFYKIS